MQLLSISCFNWHSSDDIFSKYAWEKIHFHHLVLYNRLKSCISIILYISKKLTLTPNIELCYLHISIWNYNTDNCLPTTFCCGVKTRMRRPSWMHYQRSVLHYQVFNDHGSLPQSGCLTLWKFSKLPLTSTVLLATPTMLWTFNSFRSSMHDLHI